MLVSGGERVAVSGKIEKNVATIRPSCKNKPLAIISTKKGSAQNKKRFKAEKTITRGKTFPLTSSSNKFQ